MFYRISTVMLAAVLVTLLATSASVNFRVVSKSLCVQTANSVALTGVTAASEALLVPATLHGSQTITKQRINFAGARIPFRCAFKSTSDDDGVETLQVRGRLGGLTGQVLFDTGTQIIGAASHTDIPWIVNGELVVTSAGATGTGYATGTITYQLGAAAPVSKPFLTEFTGFDFTTAGGTAFKCTALFAASPDGGDTVTQVCNSVDHVTYD